jgi:cell division protease FtsH
VVNKITIIPRGRAAGITWFLPEERDFSFKEQLLSRLAILLGGRVAEEIIYNRLSTGASNDIKKATELANKMIRDWGMSKKLGPLSYSLSNDQVFLGREISQHRDYSEETARLIDQEVTAFITHGYDTAKQILTDNVDILHRLTEILLEKETISGAALDELILSMRPGITLPSARDEIGEIIAPEAEESRTDD